MVERSDDPAELYPQITQMHADVRKAEPKQLQDTLPVICGNLRNLRIAAWADSVLVNGYSSSSVYVFYAIYRVDGSRRNWGYSASSAAPVT